MKKTLGWPQGTAFLAWFASMVLLTGASGWEWSVAYFWVLVVAALTLLSLVVSALSMASDDH